MNCLVVAACLAFVATSAPWETTSGYSDCASYDELAACNTTFTVDVHSHVNSPPEVCRDLAVFSGCILGISCLTVEERYQRILDATAVVRNLNIFCDSIGPDDGGNMSGSNLTTNKPIFSHLLVLGIMVVMFLKYN